MPIMMGAIAAAMGTEWSSSDWSDVDWRADIVFDRSICDGAIFDSAYNGLCREAIGLLETGRCYARSRYE